MTVFFKRKRPEIVTALQFPPGGIAQRRAARWVWANDGTLRYGQYQQLATPDADGASWQWGWAYVSNLWERDPVQEVVHIGDWIVRSPDAKFSVMSARVFEHTYEAANT